MQEFQGKIYFTIMETPPDVTQGVHYKTTRTTSTTLNISDVTGLGGNQYFVAVTHTNHVCETLTSANLTVNNVPIANDDVRTTPLNTPLNIPVLINDTFGPDGPSTGTITQLGK